MFNNKAFVGVQIVDQESFPDPFYNLNYGHYLQCTSETITI